jgi:hypothetical protein
LLKITERGEIAIKVYERNKVTQVGGRNGFLGSRVVGWEANGTTDRGRSLLEGGFLSAGQRRRTIR